MSHIQKTLIDKINDSRKETKTSKMYFNVTPRTREKLQYYCKKYGITMTEWFEQNIELSYDYAINDEVDPKDYE